MELPTPPNPHGTPLLRVLALLIFALLVAVLSSFGTYYYILSQQTNPTNPTIPIPSPDIYMSPTPESDLPNGKACSQEAKICPDGSSVGRTGPNCEFAPCPDN